MFFYGNEIDTPDLMRILYRYWMENARGIVLDHAEFERMEPDPERTGHGLRPLDWGGCL